MQISELIATFEQIKEKHGDIDVMYSDPWADHPSYTHLCGVKVTHYENIPFVEIY